MPTLEVNLKDLEKLVGKKLPADLDELFMLVKGEVDKKEGNTLTLDIKDTNRPDLWSAEGLARELKAKLGKEKGLPKYKVKKGKVELKVEESVSEVRPFIAAAVVRNVKFSEDFLIQMIQLQEKVAMTFGRRRREAAIGIYDFDKMQPPIYYRGYKDKEIEFVPLEYKVSLRPSEILQEHPKGKEFAKLLEGAKYYPFVIDANNEVASMPPIINSQTTGKVTHQTKNLFVEVTGFKWDVVNTALNVMVMALADRGGQIEAVKIKFPKVKGYPRSPQWTPFFETNSLKLDLNYTRKMAGLDLSNKQIIKLLEQSRFQVKGTGNKVTVTFPSYRQDIFHPIDLVEDVLIGYGYNNVEPLPVELAVKGKERPETMRLDAVREACVGLGLQEVLQYTLTSKEVQQDKMNLKDEEFVELANPISLSYNVFRKSLIPNLLEFFSRNKNALYPQRLFETGKTFRLDERMENKVNETNRLCVAVSKSQVSFTEIKSLLEAYSKAMNLKLGFKRIEHPSFIPGRVAEIYGDKLGVIGEIHPQVLHNFGLENPVILFELEV
jgi:phenylalanyl-tRNA synthetase beta chain